MNKLFDARTRSTFQSVDPSPFLPESADDNLTDSNASGDASGAVASMASSAVVGKSSGSSVPSSQTVTTPGANITFVNSYDNTVTAAYQACIVAAEKQLETLFHGKNAVTITASFTQKAFAAGSGAALQNSAADDAVGFSTLEHSLPSSDVLPSSDPSGGQGTWFVPQSYARMMGYSGATSSGTDINVSLNTNDSWSYGQDVINGLTHELSEGALGREGALGYDYDINNVTDDWQVMDLFRYDSAGQYDTSNGRDGQTTYFSADGGKTLSESAGLSFNNQYNSNGTLNNSGDSDDWNQQAVFGATGGGETLTLVQSELNVMAALGWSIQLPEAFFDASGNWETAANWSAGFQPITPQDVFIDSGSYTATLGDADDVVVNSVSVGGSAKLYITGGAQLTATDGSSTNPETTGATDAEGNFGTIYVQPNSTFAIGSGHYNNTSLIYLGQTANGPAGTLDLEANITFEGGGNIELADYDDLVFAQGGIFGAGLVNVDNRISGEGVITLNTFDNQAKGIVEANQPEGTTDQNTLELQVPTVSNEGTFDVDPGAILYLGATSQTLTNSGTVNVGNSTTGGHATLEFSGATTLTGGGTLNLGLAANQTYAASTGSLLGGSGASFVNVNNTIQGGGIIDVANFDNQGNGFVDASQSEGDDLSINVSGNFTNEGEVNVEERAGLTLGADGAYEGVINAGDISLGYDGHTAGLEESTLAIAGAYNVEGSGAIVLKGAGAAIDSDGVAGSTLTNQSLIEAVASGEIGGDEIYNGDVYLTLVNTGTILASDATLTIDTGANVVADDGGVLEAQSKGVLILDSATTVGESYFYFPHATPPAGGTLEATTGGTVEIAAAVTQGSPLFGELLSGGDVVVGAGSSVVVEAEGSVAVPVEIDGTSGSTAGGVLTLDAGGAVSGEITFESAGGRIAVEGASTTIHVNGGGGEISLLGASDVLDLSGAAAIVGVLADNDYVDLTSSLASVLGGGDTVEFAAGTGDQADLAGTGASWDIVDEAAGTTGAVDLNQALATIVGAGYAVEYAGGAGDVASLWNTGNSWDHVSASTGVVGTTYLSNALANIVGGGETVEFAYGSGDAASLWDTGDAWDNVSAASGVTGAVYLSDALGSLVGGGDTIVFAYGSGDAASLWNTGTAWDNVSATTGVVGTTYLSNALANIVGGGETVEFAYGSGDAASLWNTGDAWDMVSAASGVTGTLYLSNALASLVGGGDTVVFANGSGDAASLWNTSGVADTVDTASAPGTIYVNNAQALVNGGGDTIDFSYPGADGVTVSGAGETFIAEAFSGAIAIAGYAAASDLFDLSAAQFGTSWTTFKADDVSQTSAGTVITDPNNHANQITLSGVNPASLVQANFHFV